MTNHEKRYKTLTVGKTLTADDIIYYGTLMIKSGATLTLNGKTKNVAAYVKLEKGAKPINIGKNFNFDDYTAIKLAKANDTDDFVGTQIFSVPTKDFDFDAFKAIVDYTGLKSGKGYK